jgi:hypothetical protein
LVFLTKRWPIVAWPNIVRPNIIQPNVFQPNVIQPNVVQPTVVQPTVVQPNGLIVYEIDNTGWKKMFYLRPEHTKGVDTQKI